MRHVLRTAAVVFLMVSATRSGAQQQAGAGQQAGQTVPAGRGSTPPSYETRVFPLEYLSNADALKLVSPFGPAYDAGTSIHAVTVHASKDVLARIDSLLKAVDRPPTTVVLRFQLIAAVDSATKDSSIPSDVDASLRDLFKFGGYRLLAEGTTINSGSDFMVSMSAKTSEGRYPELYTVSGELAAQPPTSAGGRSVRLKVYLTQNGSDSRAGGPSDRLLQTGLSIPFGQTVVLGSAAAVSGGTGRRALILTVRPELQKAR